MSRPMIRLSSRDSSFSHSRTARGSLLTAKIREEWGCHSPAQCIKKDTKWQGAIQKCAVFPKLAPAASYLPLSLRLHAARPERAVTMIMRTGNKNAIKQKQKAPRRERLSH
jgi:hypothetical protein